jgi:hypothetical protein
MFLILVSLAWTLLLALVLVLCAAARMGDADRAQGRSAARSGPAAGTPAEGAATAVDHGIRVAEPSGPLARGEIMTA